ATIDAALNQIDQLATTEINGRRILDGSTSVRTSGVISTQVKDVQVYSTGAGNVVTSATQAELVHTGSNRKLAADAVVTITGDVGSTTIEFNQDDSLESVAEEINARTLTTGVHAVVDDNQLSLKSTKTGTLADVAVTVDSGSFAVSGGNGDGTANGTDGVYSATPSIGGKVIEAATQASVVYTGSSGQATAASTITITGATGSASIEVAINDDLTDVRDLINLESHKTGLTASVSGDDLTISSVKYGTNATLDVTVESGTFDVTGGNEDGTAQGTNAVAEINGHLVSGNTAATAASVVFTELIGQLQEDVDFDLEGDSGTSYSFSFNATDTLTDIETAVNLQTGTTGVRATVSSDGFDLTFESVTQGSTSTVNVEVTDGTFEVEAGDDSTATNVVPEQQAELTYSTTDGLASATAEIDLTGLDSTTSSTISITAGDTLYAIADDINDTTGETGVAAKVQGDDLILYSVDRGVDAFADLDVISGTFTVTGGDGDDIATGVDPITEVQGKDAVTNQSAVNGNKVTVNQNGTHFVIEFKEGYTGDINTITLDDSTALQFNLSTQINDTTTLALSGVGTTQLGGISGTLNDIASGGSLAGLSTNASQAIRVVDEALAELDRIEGQVDGFADRAVASSSALLSGFKESIENSLESVDGVNDTEEALLLQKNQQLVSNVISSLSVLNQQRSGIIKILQQIAGV
ncbi:MAG: flagellin hook IN motif-containing protein, partial [Pirellulales bacterium]